MPILVPLIAENPATSGPQIAAQVGTTHPNGTLCICRPNRTLWYYNGAPSGAWARVTL